MIFQLNLNNQIIELKSNEEYSGYIDDKYVSLLIGNPDLDQTKLELLLLNSFDKIPLNVKHGISKKNIYINGSFLIKNNGPSTIKFKFNLI